MIGMGEDRFIEYVHGLDRPKGSNEFKGGPRLYHFAYLISSTIYSIFLFLFLIIFPIYVIQNPENYDSFLAIIFHGTIIFFVSLIAFPILFVMAFIQSIKVILMDLDTLVVVNEDSMRIVEDIDHFHTREVIIPLSNIKYVHMFKNLPLKERLPLLIKRRSLIFRRHSKDAFHSIYIPTSGIVIIGLNTSTEYDTCRIKKGNFVRDTTYKFSFEIRKKDQKRFFSLLDSNL